MISRMCARIESDGTIAQKPKANYREIAPTSNSEFQRFCGLIHSEQHGTMNTLIQFRHALSLPSTLTSRGKGAP